VLWGDLHRHTSRSRCAGDQDGLFLDAVRWARRERVDFFAITDHFQHLQPWSWWQNARDVERWNDPPRTLVLHGLERAHEGEGHQNLIFRSAASAQLDAPAGVAPGDLIAIPHMIYLGDNPFPPARWDGELQRLLEVYQANRGSYEGVGLPLEANGVRAPDSDLRTAHALGQTPGLIAASDHSQTDDGWAGVLVAERTRAALFDALRARHTFASTSRRELRLSLGELAMGDAGPVDPNAELVLQIPASDAPLAAIDVLKNGAPWHRAEGQGEVELYALTTRYRQTPEDSPLVLTSPSGLLANPRMRRAEKEGGRFEARSEGLALWRSGTSASLLFELSGAEALEVAFGRSRQLVQLSELAPGASMRLMELQGRLDHLWRLGPPLGIQADHELRLPDPERASGDIYYARVTWTDGELAWTSPVVVR